MRSQKTNCWGRHGFQNRGKKRGKRYGFPYRSHTIFRCLGQNSHFLSCCSRRTVLEGVGFARTVPQRIDLARTGPWRPLLTHAALLLQLQQGPKQVHPQVISTYNKKRRSYFHVHSLVYIFHWKVGGLDDGPKEHSREHQNKSTIEQYQVC